MEDHKKELQRKQAELDMAFAAVNKKLSTYESIEEGCSDVQDTMGLR